ncbi:MAG: MAG0490 family ComEA-like DNA-binding protein [Metamycoplasmataceae bacterium]|uniref:MAG0490 family ComEA-like DNA-binding protein n=1 Tax=Mycoplasmopsis lipophila TaxID=2117 RepID=UPI0038734754
MKRFTKKQWIIILFIIFTISLTSISAFSSIYIQKNKKDNHEYKQNNLYITIKVFGEVKYPGTYTFKKDVTYFEIFKKVGIKNNSDLSSFNLNEKIKENLTIKVLSLKKSKIKWIELNNKEQLINMGISKSISEKIIFLRKKKINITWEDLNEISGIGPKTLEKLKRILIL